MNSSDKSVKILAMFDEEKVLVKKLDSLLGKLSQTEKENLYYNDEPIIFSTLFLRYKRIVALFGFKTVQDSNIDTLNLFKKHGFDFDVVNDQGQRILDFFLQNVNDIPNGTKPFNTLWDCIDIHKYENATLLKLLGSRLLDLSLIHI